MTTLVCLGEVRYISCTSLGINRIYITIDTRSVKGIFLEHFIPECFASEFSARAPLSYWLLRSRRRKMESHEAATTANLLPRSGS